jgi:hypothetical protein
VLLHDVPGDREAQPEPAVPSRGSSVGLTEAIEDEAAGSPEGCPIPESVTVMITDRR